MRILLISLLILTSYFPVFSDERRIGWLANQSLESYEKLGANQPPYQSSLQYPDLSVVGALISSQGNKLGTATLIAPDVVVTAAHVLENYFSDNADPSEWKFYLGAERSDPDVYEIESFTLHPSWKIRQKDVKLLDRNNVHIGDGDGDLLGVDIALAYLKAPILDVFPARLPNEYDDPLGERAVLAGFGNVVNGATGVEDFGNSKRIGGENTFDRSVAKVSVPQTWDPDGDNISEPVLNSSLGGLLGVDFDSPSNLNNSLGQGESIDLLGNGTSVASPLSLEASTAPGDSGGPAFSHTQDYWRVHGVVSYGTTNSTYGDVTIYTRLASHFEWLQNNLPNWADSRMLGNSGWRENPWLGIFAPFDKNWNFHRKLGWLYIPFPKGNFFFGRGVIY